MPKNPLEFVVGMYDPADFLCLDLDHNNSNC